MRIFNGKEEKKENILKKYHKKIQSRLKQKEEKWQYLPALVIKSYLNMNCTI